MNEEGGIVLHLQWFLGSQHIFPVPMEPYCCDLSDTRSLVIKKYIMPKDKHID